MRLLDLVEQHDLIGPTPHRLGKHPALLIADIARRRADQASNGVLLHELAHVDADHRAVIVEQEARKCLGQLGLADARGAEEQEGAERPAGVLETGARAANGLRDGLDGLRLADHPLTEDVLHVEQLLALAFHHLVDRNAGPAADHPGDVLLGHLLAQHGVGGLALRLGELPFQLGDAPVGKLPGLRQIALALGLFQFEPRGVERLLDAPLCRDLVALVLPAGGEFGGLLFEIGKILAQRDETVPGVRVGLLLERLFLDLKLDDLAVERLDFLGLAFHLHADAARRLVHQVNGLVGEEAVLDVAIGQLRRRDDRTVGDAHAVVQLVLVLDAAQDRDRVLDARLLDVDRLEPSLERGVLLNIFLVLVEGRGADAMQFAARQGGLQQVRGVHRAFARARPDQGVHLVDEQDDLPLGMLDLVEHGLEPLLELAAILRPRDQRAHVERHERAALEAVGHVAIGDAQREAFRDRGLAGAGLADQGGVVLGTPGEDLDGAADLLVAADDGVELALACGPGEVAGELFHGVVGAFGPRAVGTLAAPQGFDRRVERLRGHPCSLQGLACGTLREGKRGQQALDGDVGISGLVGELFGAVEHPYGIIVQPRRGLRSAAGHRRDLRKARIDGRRGQRGLPTRPLDQPGGHAFAVLQQRLGDVQGRDALVVHADRDGLRGLQEALRTVGELFEIHLIQPFQWLPPQGSVAQWQHKCQCGKNLRAGVLLD